MNSLWRQLIEAPAHELPLLGRDESLPEEVRNYARVVAAFLRGDTEELQEWDRRFRKEKHAVAQLTRLRLKVRTRETSELDQFEELEGELEAERNFCLGMAWDYAGDDRRSIDHFQKAAALYRENECPRKALRAMYNSIAAESTLIPHKNYLADCQAIIESSRALGDRSFEGMALTFISREYQIIGLFDKALEMACSAIDCLSSERGYIHYFHALLHKAHLLLDLKRDAEVGPLLRESELCAFPQIHAARELLKVALNPQGIWNRDLEKDMLPTWRNRIPQLIERRSVASSGERSPTELEDRLLKLAYNGPVEKWDLITRLYPEDASPLILENRFKNLLGRIRKKYPGAVVCKDGRYSLDRIPIS